MRLRRRRHGASVLFLSVLAVAITVSVAEDASDAAIDPEASLTTTIADVAQASALAKAKADVGTKAAPVDGKDGKPHRGPWVGLSADRGKEEESEDGVTKEASSGKKPSPRPWTEQIIPKANEGVMDDPNREAPKKGTTGTEGGVSEKERDRKAQEGQTGERTEMRPDPPKESPPLPHSEEEKIRVTEAIKDDGKDADKDRAKDDMATSEDTASLPEVGGLAKPTDLPPKPHDAPPPRPPTSKTDHLGAIPPNTEHGPSVPAAARPPADANGLIQPLHSLVLSLTMILFSEIGDKTFLIAALMAMKHPRLLVFSAAFTALIAMTVLSAVLGHAVPTLIPKRFTNFLAAALFLAFGAKMLREAHQMRPDETASEEMKEVEMELEEREHLARKHGRHRRSSLSPYVLEAGRGGGGGGVSSLGSPRKVRSNSRLPSPPLSPSLSSPSRSPSPSSSSPRSPSANLSSTVRNGMAGLNNLLTFLLSPAWVQTFVMTFLGEWGDRSQIATIAMAAGQDYWWVTVGAVTGHALCTAAAVIGGRAVAGRVSLRVVTLGGAIAFLAFGIIYLAEAMYYQQ